MTFTARLGRSLETGGIAAELICVTHRSVFRSSVVAGLGLALVAVGLPASAAPDPSPSGPTVETRSLDLTAEATAPSPDDAPEAADDGTITTVDGALPGRIVTDQVAMDGFQTVAVTWPGGTDPGAWDIQVRSQSADSWSDWHSVESEASDGTDAAVGGSESVWLGDDVTAVQLSFAAAAQGSDGVELTLIGSDLEPAAAAAPVERLMAAASAAPAMYTRTQWSAAPQTCTPDVASRLVGAVVHHTAGSNAYSTVAQAMQQIRNDQAYHQHSRGWCDLGYNFVVDKWGNLYEGRAGSLTSPVIGVHAGGFNTGTVGVSMLGTYTTTAVPQAQINMVAQIIGYRLAAYGVDPRGAMSYATGSGDNARYKNTTVTLPVVFGHSDTSYTACPGAAGYSTLTQIRILAYTQMDPAAASRARAVVYALYADLLGRGPDPTGLEGWSAALLSGVSQSALVSSLTASDEYISRRVATAYQQVLGRGPDPTGAASWLQAVRSGQLSVDAVTRRLVDSDEFYASTGGTDQGYVRRLYQSFLGRGVSSGELTSWVSMTQQYGRTWLVESVWWSFEAASVRAGGYYQTFLGRGPDPTGLTAWTQVLLGYGEGTVRAGIAGSAEYTSRAVARFPSA